jgi:hypothetical protein
MRKTLSFNSIVKKQHNTIIVKEQHNTIIVMQSVAVGLCDTDDDDGDNGGNDPLITELDLDDLATRVPPELLEPSQPSVESEQTTADPTATSGESPGEREGVREVLTMRPIHYTKLATLVYF